MPTLEPHPLPLERAATLFKALSDPARLTVLRFLADSEAGRCLGPTAAPSGPGRCLGPTAAPSGPGRCCASGVCACDLEPLLGLSQPTVSHHMKLLIGAGLVRPERRGKWTYYTLEPQGFALVREALAALER